MCLSVIHLYLSVLAEANFPPVGGLLPVRLLSVLLSAFVLISAFGFP